MRQVIIHRADEDETGYWAEVPSLPGCYGEGETLDEVLENVKESIRLYIEVLIEDGRPVLDS